MMRTWVTKVACFAAILLGSSVAAAQGSGEEGTPDAQPRRVELEAAPPSAGDKWDQHGAGPRLQRRPPRTLPYYEWSPIPWGYHLQMGSGRKTLLTVGVALLGVGHIGAQVTGFAAATVGCGAQHRLQVNDCGKHVAELQAPVVGPWLAFAGHGNSEPKWFYPILGSVQTTGFLMILVGATLNDKRLVRDDHAFPLAPQVSVAPEVAPGQYGLSLHAAF
jgi:hypothetical protein